MSFNSQHNTLYRYRYFLIFGVFFLIYIGFAYHLVFNLHSVYGDAVTRTEKPYLVLYDNEQKLATLGFIWPPLPSIVQLPVLAVFKGLAQYGFAGNLMTAFFGALNMVLIYFFIEKIRTTRWVRLLLLMLYGLNPMILFYAINGMSETAFLFFVVAIAWHFFQWQEKGCGFNFHLLSMSLLLALAYLTRYETLALLCAVGALVFFSVILKDTKLVEVVNKKGDVIKQLYRSKKISKAFDLMMFTLVPVIFIVGLWSVLNWMIMGDPLYFFHGDYSVSEQSNMISGEAKDSSFDIVAAASYSAERIVFLFPAFTLLLLFLALRSRSYSWKLWSMVLLALTIPAFEIFMHFLGKSFGWLRFFIYIIPFTHILLSVAWYESKRVRYYVIAIVIALLFISGISSAVAMYMISYGKEEFRPIRAFLANKKVHEVDFTYDGDVEIGKYLKMIMKPGERVLIDDFIGFGIILNHGDPKVFINDSDKEFNAAVNDPQKWADYILVPSLFGVQKLDIINQTYVDFFEKGTDFTELEKDFGKWRLYKVVH